MSKSRSKRKIVIDTDPGVDDALAIFFALASPELEIVGLTTVFGNAAVEITTRNALRLLEIAGHDRIPVARGAAAPIAGTYPGPVPHVHGADGMGDCGDRPPSIQVIAKPAAEFLCATVAATPGEITILAIGPLTNLALALRLWPDIASRVERVVLMGGNALGPGNATPAAEANILNDPEAADIVLGAAWPVTMVGLDVTHRTNLRGREIERIGAPAKPVNRHLACALPLYRSFFERVNHLDGIYLHDPSAVAYLIDPTLFHTRSWPIRVETQGISRGKTWPSLGDTDDLAPAAWQGRPLLEVCTEVDSARLIELLVGRLG
jgi:purine nucleosidase